MIASVGAHTASCNGGRAPLLQVVLLRHAESCLHGRFCGHSDPELTEKGRTALPAIISRLGVAPPSAIWCSDLVRAKETATKIAEHFGVVCRPSVALREMNFGLWEGLSWKEVEAQFPEDARAWARCFPHHHPPGGESFVGFQSRVVSELKRVSTDAGDGYMLVVTHAGFIRVATAWVLGIPDNRISRIAVDHGAAVVLWRAGEQWTVVVPNPRDFGLPAIIAAKEDRGEDCFFGSERD
jgi:broad specificity phosphatase PhoE